MSQDHKAKAKSKAKAEETETEAKDVKDAELDQETEDLLADIDSVLEENAEAFVAAYIQKGGE
jgi:ubiquitin-like protein Pup